MSSSACSSLLRPARGSCLLLSAADVAALTAVCDTFPFTLADTILSLLTLRSTRSNPSATRPLHPLSTLSAGEHPSYKCLRCLGDVPRPHHQSSPGKCGGGRRTSPCPSPPSCGGTPSEGFPGCGNASPWTSPPTLSC